MRRHWKNEVEIHRLREELNRLLEQLLDEPPGQSAEWQPAIDVLRTEQAVVVEIEVPGIQAADLSAEMCGSQLVVRGVKRRLRSEPDRVRFHLMERFIGTFSATVTIPEPVNTQEAQATLTRGVLKVSLPRITDRRQVPIPIHVHEEESNRD